MPISGYDKYFSSTKKGGAQKALSAMEKRYGTKKGKQVFYSVLALRRKTHGKDTQSHDKKNGRFDKNEKFSQKKKKESSSS